MDDQGWQRRDHRDAARRRLGPAGVLLSTMLPVAALAAPPADRGPFPSSSGGESTLERLGSWRPSADHRSLALSKLDLRAPVNWPAPAPAEERPGQIVDAPAVPQASAHAAAEDWVRARLQEDLPALGNDAAIHTSSRVQQLAQRFRREGLPLARLFESRSALVSLGLNQRGKPGIWLIQKIP